MHAALGLTAIFAPQLAFSGIGPLKPMFDGPENPAMLSAIRLAGGPLMFMAFSLFVVRWNVINGKAGMLGCLIAAANAAHISLSMDSYVFVPRMWFVLSAVWVLTALHLGLNANPMLTSKMLAEKEKSKSK